MRPGGAGVPVGATSPRMSLTSTPVLLKSLRGSAVPVRRYLWRRLSNKSASPASIAALHADAVGRGDLFYTDPDTGLMVMTELASLKRGRCCGKACRHCAYQHSSVCGEAPEPITTPELEEKRSAGLILEKPAL